MGARRGNERPGPSQRQRDRERLLGGESQRHSQKPELEVTLQLRRAPPDTGLQGRCRGRGHTVLCWHLGARSEILLQRRCPLPIWKDRALSFEPLEGDFSGLVRTNRDMRSIEVRGDAKVKCRR